MFGECMALISLRHDEVAPVAAQGGVVAVGNFDGVHRGHAALVDVARTLGESGGMVVPVTFDPHPLKLLAPDRYQPPLTTIAERTRLLHELGAGHVIVLQTDRNLLALTPHEFFEKIIRQSLRATGIVEGFNFHFGRDRAGSNDTLRSLCRAAKIEFREVPAFTIGDRPVSSSRVREAISVGDMATTTELLGRPYRITGDVVTGARRGRTIGFPTANLEHVETVVPSIGVYAVSAPMRCGVFTGAANVGPNPTFGEDSRKIEVHLIDFDGDLYGQTIDVDFVAKLRDTRKFANVDALIEQMRADVVIARRIVAGEEQNDRPA
jgi:riboflavin kinase/FMN adenylyltransferase